LLQIIDELRLSKKLSITKSKTFITNSSYAIYGGGATRSHPEEWRRGRIPRRRNLSLV